jgi:hypothetical protein
VTTLPVGLEVVEPPPQPVTIHITPEIMKNLAALPPIPIFPSSIYDFCVHAL